MDNQKTIKEKFTITDIGLFTGEKVTLTIHPAKENHGIVFKRTDLPKKPLINASLDLVEEADGKTTIGRNKEIVMTVEHLLSAIKAYGIDNALIEIDGPEVPICDGSAKVFSENIIACGIETFNEKKIIYEIDQPIAYSDKFTHLVAIPDDEFKITFTFHHPTNNFIKSQYYSYVVSENSYLEEIAPSRTFSVYEEIKALLDNNMIKGGNLNNALLIKDDRVINPGGVRFIDEMVRHKILDLIGDLSLMAKNFKAHIIAIRSGHFSNVRFAKKLINFLKEKKKNEGL